MVDAFARGSASKDSPAVKATLKELGIKDTYAAIKAFLGKSGEQSPAKTTPSFYKPDKETDRPKMREGPTGNAPVDTDFAALPYPGKTDGEIWEKERNEYHREGSRPQRQSLPPRARPEQAGRAGRRCSARS